MLDEKTTGHGSAGHGAKDPSPLDTDEIPVLVPPDLERPRWRRTWALGSAAVVLAAFMAASGLLLMLYYRPLVAAAHPGLVDLVEASRLAYLRALHRWVSHALLVVTVLHLLRVIVSGAYRPPRQLNYHAGVALLAVVLGLATTGYILPWDGTARWLLAFLPAVRAENVSGDAILTSVYALHCAFLPLAGAGLVAFHVRRAHLDETKESTKDDETKDGGTRDETRNKEA